MGRGVFSVGGEGPFRGAALACRCGVAVLHWALPALLRFAGVRGVWLLFAGVCWGDGHPPGEAVTACSGTDAFWNNPKWC